MQAHVAFNNLDYIILGIVLVSGLFALMRGFVREALSLASWAGAYYVAAKFHPLLIPMTHKYIKSQPAVTIASATVMFVGALVVFTLISFLLSRLIRGQALTAIDRSLGFIFGVLRGVFFVSILFLVAQTVLWPSLETIDPNDVPKQTAPTSPESEKKDLPPEWIYKARTFEAMRTSAKLLKSLLPKSEMDKLNKQAIDQRAAAQKMIDDKALELLSTPTAAAQSNNTSQGSGYSDAVRSDLNQKVGQ